MADAHEALFGNEVGAYGKEKYGFCTYDGVAVGMLPGAVAGAVPVHTALCRAITLARW